MAHIVNMHQAKASLSRLVERALDGEEVIIARNGQPLVRLVPEPPRKSSVPSGLKGKTASDSEPADEEVTESFEAPLFPGDA